MNRLKGPDKRRTHSDRLRAEYFDGLAEEWDAQSAHHPQKLRYIAGVLGLRAGQTVLDVGSGTGVMIPYLLESVGVSGLVVAADCSAKMIAVARSKYPPGEYPNVKFEVRDVNEMPMRGQYNAILCYSCFPHLGDQRATVIHLAAGLRNRGTLTIAHSESREAINRLHRKSTGHVRHDFLPPMSEMRRMMETAGLEVVMQMDTRSVFIISGQHHSCAAGTSRAG